MSEGRLPDFVMLGAMRAGSTSLYRYIDAHPDVFVAPKELQYFTDGFDRGLDWYRDQFSDVGGARILGEATADYFARESAMRRIAEILPDAKLVVSLRNPVDRAYSHYGLLAARGREPRSFAAAIDDELREVNRHGDRADGVIYLSHSMYDVHLERIDRLFAPDQLFVSIFERMVARPEDGFAELCRFLGVDDAVVPDNLGRRVNPYVTFRSLRVRDLSRSLPSPLGRLVARLNTNRDTRPDPADPRVVERLVEFFAPRITAVEQRLAVALPEWR